MRVALVDFFANSPLLALPVLALVLFILVFGSVIVRVVRAGARSYDEVARLPLEPDAVHEDEERLP